MIVSGTWHVKSVTGPAVAAQFAFGGGGDQPLYFGRGAVPNPRADAARFLQQTTFGPTEFDIQNLLSGATWWQNSLAWQLVVPHTPLPTMPWWPQSTPRPPTGVTWPVCQWCVLHDRRRTTRPTPATAWARPAPSTSARGTSTPTSGCRTSSSSAR